jgi:hypothetical protein
LDDGDIPVEDIFIIHMLDDPIYESTQEITLSELDDPNGTFLDRMYLFG